MVTRVPPESDTAEFDTQDTEQPPEEDVVALKFEIASYPADYTLRVLNDQIKEKQLRLPDFQRGYVWTRTQASRLIESFLLGLPVPEVFLYKDRSSERRLVVDGHQRLATIAYFYRERFHDDKAFRLRGVDPRWEGKLYSDLDENDRLRIDNSTLRSIVIQQLDPRDHSSIYLTFERLNTGGSRLVPMEIRRVQFSSHAFPFLAELNVCPQWRGLIGTVKPHPRLKDIELVLRILAMATDRGSYKKPLKSFLNEHMRILEDMSAERRASLAGSFRSACTVALDELGPKPFHINGPLNVAVLDTVLAILASQATPAPADLRARYASLLKDPTFLRAIERATSDEESVRDRFASATAILRA